MRLSILVRVALHKRARAKRTSQCLHLSFHEPLPAPVVDEAIVTAANGPSLTFTRSLYISTNRGTIGQLVARTGAQIKHAFQRTTFCIDTGYAIHLPPAAAYAIAKIAKGLTCTHVRFTSPKRALTKQPLRREFFAGRRRNQVDHAAQGVAAEFHTRRAFRDFNTLRRDCGQSANVAILDQRAGCRLAINQDQHARRVKAANRNRCLRWRRWQFLKSRYLSQQLIRRDCSCGINVGTLKHGGAHSGVARANFALAHGGDQCWQHCGKRLQYHAHRRADGQSLFTESQRANNDGITRHGCECELSLLISAGKRLSSNRPNLGGEDSLAVSRTYDRTMNRARYRGLTALSVRSNCAHRAAGTRKCQPRESLAAKGACEGTRVGEHQPAGRFLWRRRSKPARHTIGCELSAAWDTRSHRIHRSSSLLAACTLSCRL